MIILWIVLALAGAGLLALAVLIGVLAAQTSRERNRATVHEIAGWAATLLHTYGAVLIAEPVGRPGFVQFALTGRRGQWRRVEFGLPETDWSRDAVPRVLDVLATEGIPWTVEVDPGNDAVPRFYRASMEGPDHEIRERLAALIPRLADALGFPPTARYRVTLAGGYSLDATRELEERLRAAEMEVTARGPRERRVIGFFRRRIGNLRAREERAIAESLDHERDRRMMSERSASYAAATNTTGHTYG